MTHAPRSCSWHDGGRRTFKNESPRVTPLRTVEAPVQPGSGRLLQVKEFHPAHWPGPLYCDDDKALYRALGGGQVSRGSVLQLLNPFSAAWGNVRAAQKSGVKGNLKGDGQTMGGLFLMGAGDAGVKLQHREKTFGDHVETAKVRRQSSVAVMARLGHGPHSLHMLWRRGLRGVAAADRGLAR